MTKRNPKVPAWEMNELLGRDPYIRREGLAKKKRKAGVAMSVRARDLRQIQGIEDSARDRKILDGSVWDLLYSWSEGHHATSWRRRIDEAYEAYRGGIPRPRYATSGCPDDRGGEAGLPEDDGASVLGEVPPESSPTPSVP